MELNQDKVRKITSEILTSIERLEEIKKLPKNTFLSEPHKIGSAKYSLIVAIEGAIDLCNHIIAKNGYRTPEDYADTFKVMTERGAFDAEFTNTLIQMARFRNRLVHIYWEVDNNELYHILQTRLQDIKEFLKKFGAFIGLK
ncbi:MAG: antitoxin [Nitrospirae bacterium RIFCSPHIGHO2_02_FULL_40_19]|nr:MAG: antitoxin [Nitrospirae bacterium RIFCSPHIGHO2_02_FULL_40_19]